MAKVFLKSIYSFILVVLLISNIAMFFGLVKNVFSFAPMNVSDTFWQDKYVNFTNFMSFLQTNDWQTNFLNGFQTFIANIQNFITTRFDGSIWSNTDFNFFDFIFNLFSYFIVPFAMLFNLIAYVGYLLSCVFFIIINILQFMSGGIYTQVPTFTYQ